MCLACRLARLTPFQAVTLYALRPDKHAGFHGIVEITTNSRFHVRNPRASRVARRLFLPAGSSSGEEAPGLLDARLIEIQMSIWRRYEHILGTTTMGARGAGRWHSECGVLLVSLRDVENGRRIAPMFALEFCSVDEDLKLQGCTSTSCPSVLFYSHVGQANTSRFRGRSRLVTSAATSAAGTDVSPLNVQHDQRL